VAATALAAICAAGITYAPEKVDKNSELTSKMKV
jgi:hypothetical protein